MAAFVIFWSAAFAILFFVSGIVFKALASVFNALLVSITGISGIGGLAGLAGVALYLLYAIIDGIIKEGFWSVVGSIILLLIVLGLVGGILGGFGAALLGLVLIVATIALDTVSGILEWLAATCERQYVKCLAAMMHRLNKC